MVRKNGSDPEIDSRSESLEVCVCVCSLSYCVRMCVCVSVFCVSVCGRSYMVMLFSRMRGVIGVGRMHLFA